LVFAALLASPASGPLADKLPLYLGFFQFVHNARRRGKALLGAFIAGLVA
jgi:transposase